MEGGREGRGGDKIVILSTSNSTQIPNHKTSKKKKDISKQHSKEAIRQGKLRKNYKLFANPVFITLGRYIIRFLRYARAYVRIHVWSLRPCDAVVVGYQ